MRARVFALAPLAAAGCAADDQGLIAVDAALPADAALAPADAAPVRDGPEPLAWVDFAIVGCGSETAPGQPPCVGEAPLELRFVALAPAAIDIYRWSFGDGTDVSTAQAPTHIFELPGTYDVSLTVGGPGGTARAAVEGAVEVGHAPLGASCELDLQCASGACVCGDGACETPLDGGLCSAACSAESPCETGACADLAAADPGEPAPWQTSLCVPECEDDADCPAGRACMDLPAGDDAEDGWIRGCFAAELLAPIGGSCLAGDGAPDHERCASGLCAAEGARGMCIADCTESPCPDSAACATFADGLGPVCVHRCAGDDPCGDDPWLACEPAGSDGPRGFTVDEDPAEDGYCAPRTCEGPEECGLDGACVDGFCGPS